MQNKRSIHNSGPLGMLIRTGQIRKIEPTENENVAVVEDKNERVGESYFRTQSGIDFNENELFFVDPKECEPWKYANRLEGEMGNLDELVQSISENSQLQPALIRLHPKPHDNIKYEIIFGRRRHRACQLLNVPFLVIRKNISNIQDAIAKQDAENKSREGVSNYSNALLYKKLLNDGVFKTEKELANKLKMPVTSLNDIMAFSKVPEAIVGAIPEIHKLSIAMAVAINKLVNHSNAAKDALLKIANEIGTKINSPTKLENAVMEKLEQGLEDKPKMDESLLYKSKSGKKLFTFRINHRGVPSILINKEIGNKLDYKKLCEHLKSYMENA